MTFSPNLSFSVPHARELRFEDTFDPGGVARLTAAFKAYLQDQNFDTKLDQENFSSGAFLELSSLLASFIAEIFDVKSHLNKKRQELKDQNLLIWCRREFLQRQVYRRLQEPPYDHEIDHRLQKKYVKDCTTDLGFAAFVRKALKDQDVDQIRFATRYAREELQKPRHKRRALFKIQETIDETQPLHIPEEADLLRRDFKLYDYGIDALEATLEAQSCLKCHVRGKDTCRTGYVAKRESSSINSQKNLNGCPLDQKISEMMYFKDVGDDLAALTVIMVDNPLVAATGHRICYDCAAACIFQKQDPIHIPSTETQILRAVLDLPYGAEIYGLLLRWHPLRTFAPQIEHPNHKRVLVVGLGPAGFGLGYHLAVLGYDVFGIDGSEIRDSVATLPSYFKGNVFTPLRDFKAFENEDLPLSGFGGVAEYGITARWNKAYLRLIRLQLERLKRFYIKGATRFGSSITPNSAIKEFDFDYIALATGAGQQKQLLKDNVFHQKLLAPGIRQASDFLMTLQLQGAKREENFIPLDIDFPIHVVGGGLTAIDTATEAQAYFLFYLERLNTFLKTKSAQELETFMNKLTLAEQARFKRHHAWSNLYQKALSKGQQGVFKFLKDLGGVTVLYRGLLKDAPSTKENPHEVQSALDQGIQIQENSEVTDLLLDKFGHLEALEIMEKGERKNIQSRALFIAIGTESNRVIRDEYQQEVASLLATKQLGFYGDADPKFEGSVVKALASAKKGAQEIHQHLQNSAGKNVDKYPLKKLLEKLQVKVIEVQNINRDYRRLVVSAPLAVKNTCPGHLFKLHIPSAVIPDRQNVRAIPLLVESIDHESGTLSFTIRVDGFVTRYVKALEPGMNINLMGPTGEPFPAFKYHERIMLLTTYLRAKSLQAYMEGLKNAGKSIQLVFLDQEGISDELESDYGRYAGILLKKDIHGHALKTDAFMVHAGHDQVKEVLKILSITDHKDAPIVSSVANPMQCMMKAICAQCLQRVQDSNTGEISFIFACKNPYQSLTAKDISFSQKRLAQNDLTLKVYREMADMNGLADTH